MPIKEITQVSLKPIGYVRRKSPLEDVRDQSLFSEIIVRKGLTKALEGIEDFSHIFVVFWMHQVPNEKRNIMKVHPRGRTDLPLLGVFATRTSSRPNPVGVTVVELLARRENVLAVRGLDAFDRTPVLDLKPYDNRNEVQNIRIPEWHKRLEEK